MKTFVVNLGKIFLNGIYSIMKLLPVKKQILLVSMQSNEPSLDFRLLVEEMKTQDHTIHYVFLCKKMESSLNRKIDYVQYVWGMIGYVFKAMY